MWHGVDRIKDDGLDRNIYFRFGQDRDRYFRYYMVYFENENLIRHTDLLILLISLLLWLPTCVDAFRKDTLGRTGHTDCRLKERAQNH